MPYALCLVPYALCLVPNADTNANTDTNADTNTQHPIPIAIGTNTKKFSQNPRFVYSTPRFVYNSKLMIGGYLLLAPESKNKNEYETDFISCSLLNASESDC